MSKESLSISEVLETLAQPSSVAVTVEEAQNSVVAKVAEEFVRRINAGESMKALGYDLQEKTDEQV